MSKKDFRVIGILPSPGGPKVEIEPLDSFSLNRFLDSRDTLKVTTIEPQIGYETNKEGIQAYTMEVPDCFVRQCWGDELSLQDFDEHPLKICFYNGPNRKITGNEKEFTLLDCNRFAAAESWKYSESIKAIDYRRSDYYCFEKLACILVISALGDESPDMEGHSLFQVIGIGNENFGEVHEFISFGNSPNLFYWDKELPAINYINIEGKMRDTGFWDLRLKGYWFSFEDNEDTNMGLLEMDEMEISIVGYIHKAKQEA